MQSYGAHRLFGGGDGALNACLKMLLRHEGRTAKTDGENAFVLSAVLCKIYRQVLDEGDFGFVPPPDNNLRMEKLSEYLGVPREAAAEWLVPYPKTEAFKLQRYRVREYRDELSDILAETDETMTTAYRDDGYSLSHYLAEDDVRVCLALAPDVGGEFSLLTQMKIAGLLDKYL